MPQKANKYSNEVLSLHQPGQVVCEYGFLFFRKVTQHLCRKIKTMNPIHQTAKDFAVTAVKLGKRLQTQEREFNISNQLIRSATSISANLHEARSAESLKDYTHKVFIAFKEASETKYWINLLHETEYIPTEEFNELNKQIRAIGATLYALSTAMRKKLQNEKNSK